MLPGFSTPIPILRMFDEAKAREFYIGFLEFKVDFEYRFEPGAPLYMGISRGACVVNLSEHFGDATPGSTLRIRTDVDALVAQLSAKAYRHSRPGPPVLTSWGTKEETIRDPSGNKLVFYEDV